MTDYNKKYSGMKEIIGKCSDGDHLTDEELARYKDFMDALSVMAFEARDYVGKATFAWANHEASYADRVTKARKEKP